MKITKIDLDKASEKGYNSEMIKKAINKIEQREERKRGRLLRSLTPNEIWNEFSNSNIKLPKYNNEDLPDYNHGENNESTNEIGVIDAN